MKEFYKINLPILLIISFFMHLILLSFWLIPDSGGMINFIERKKSSREELIGDQPDEANLIENINQDDIRIINKSTFMSDRDSSAKGYITREKGYNWRSNTNEFKMPRTSDAGGFKKNKGERISSDTDDATVTLISGYRKGRGTAGNSEYSNLIIPKKGDISMNNALYYSNNKAFSFNTAKFKDFKYFFALVNKIGSNWYPPVMANVRIGGNAPGSMKINAIPRQKVLLYFILDRSGEVLDVQLVDSMGNTSLDRSCIDAIRMSKNFGKLPESIKDEYFVVPFIFNYN